MREVTTLLTGLSGLPGTNTLFFNSDSGTADEAISAAGTFWQTLCTNAGSGSSGLHSSLTAVTVGVCKIIDPADGSLVGYDGSGTDITNHGNGTAELVPFATQGLIRLFTAAFEDGRNIRGRVFVPGITEDHNNGGVLSSGAHTAWQSAVDTLTGSSFVVVYRRPRPAGSGIHGDLPARDGMFASSTAGSPWNEFAVLRSRRD
jgi:hypothetical protein